MHNERVKAYIEADVSGKLHVIDIRGQLYLTENGLSGLQSGYFADTLHLSVEGYAIWVAEIYKVTGLKDAD